MNVFCNDVFFSLGLHAIIDEMLQEHGELSHSRFWQECEASRFYAYTYADMTMLPEFFQRFPADNAIIFSPPGAARVLSGAFSGKDVLVLSMNLTIREIKIALRKRFWAGRHYDHNDYHEELHSYDSAIVKLALTGIPSRDVSTLTLLSAKTISYRKRELMKKLGVQNKTELFLKLRIIGAERHFL